MIDQVEINLTVDGDFDGCPDESWLEEVARRVLSLVCAGNQAELGVVITGQEKITELNREYLGRDRPTDVIAFHMLNGGDGDSFVQPPDGILHMGEIVISCPQALQQAGEEGHSAEREMALLIVHGILHLLGYQDGAPELKRRMRDKEKEILTQIEDMLS